jgi:sugar lactone lactonase YvrE
VAGSDLTWLGDPSVFHGEGAFWDPAVGALRYVDMFRGDVVTLQAGRSTRTHVGDVAALVRARAAGGYVVATEQGFALLDADLRVDREVRAFELADIRMNEGACDATGRLYCGSMAYDLRPHHGKLYRLDTDLSIHVVLERVSVPNGLVWASDGGTAFHADTVEGRVNAYEVDVATGAFGASSVFIDFALLPGAPDGMAMDEEGGLWVAMWQGGAIRRFDATGRHTDAIPTGVSNPTSCAFGGADGRTLYITTSRDGLGGRTEPHAGQVLAVEVGVRGAPVHAFGG